MICPDVAGRGRSDWLPAADYTYPQYLADMTVLIARLGAGDVDWLGTSMGGLIGMQLAAAAQSPVRRLILNDIGPFIPKAALARIGDYVGKDPHFASLDELEAYLRKIHAPFGPMTDQDWRHLALQGYRRRENGGFGLAYDPGIAAGFVAGVKQDVDLWALWDKIACPVLVLHGANSDVLTASDGQGNAEARPEGQGHRLRRRRPCAGAGDGRPDRRDPRLAGADSVTWRH